MSMFIVSKKNLSSCYNYLIKNYNKEEKERVKLRNNFNYLYRMNIIIWNKKYNENESIDKIDFRKFDKIDCMQFYKYLSCLNYQLEIEYFNPITGIEKRKKDNILEWFYALLNESAHDAAHATKEYREANWD